LSTVQAAPIITDLSKGVREIFAQVTRYPLEVLDPASGLEEDLGIDSVKLGEVFAVLRETYGLPEKLDLPREKLTTIGGIAGALNDYLRGDGTPRGRGVGHSHAEEPAGQRSDGGNGFGNQSAVQAAVREIFAQVTRYPLEVLDPEAGLEEDLGIDSVKLGEVFAVLREKYDLQEKLDIPREKLKSIAGIAEALYGYLVDSVVTAREQGGAHSQEEEPGSHRRVGGNGLGNQSAVRATVREIFAQVTRYPLEVLDPEAGLEEDLGIDSVKLGEVFAVLREKYDLPEKLDIPREKLKTIGGVADALHDYVSGGEALPRVFEQSSSLPSPLILGDESPRLSESAVAQSFAMLSAERKPFDGKVALVTGSGRGLGKDIVCYLAELGASVIVNSFHSRQGGEETVEQIKANGGKAIHAWGSVANPDHVKAIFERVESSFGGLDFFVSNASNGMLARLKDVTVEHWEKAFRTNVVGLHQSALRAVELMKRRGAGKIITLSTPASHGYVDYFGCMGAVKAAVESLTKSMAIEFSADNIQVNCVSPGPVYGDLLNKWPDSNRLIAQWESNTAYSRLCEARDVSHFVAYLLSDPVKLFTGSVLIMDGGISSQGW
jgi:NAD(P)-dependent dehydrogenase (short-subunit alcohol dehydrogenase family)/acyl carrier protein